MANIYFIRNDHGVFWESSFKTIKAARKACYNSFRVMMKGSRANPHNFGESIYKLENQDDPIGQSKKIESVYYNPYIKAVVGAKIGKHGREPEHKITPSGAIASLEKPKKKAKSAWDAPYFI